MSTFVHQAGSVEGQAVPRRFVRVSMTFELIASALTYTGRWSDHLRVQRDTGLPEDASLVHAEVDLAHNEVAFYFERESFAPTESPPPLAVSIESFRCDQKPVDPEN